MAFKAKASTLTFDANKRYLWQIAELGNGLKHFGYVTADQRATVEASAYFNDDEYEFTVHVGDKVTVWQVAALDDTQSIIDDLAETSGFIDTYDIVVRSIASDTIAASRNPDFTLTPTTQQFDLGTRNNDGVDNRIRVYVQASEAITLKQCIGIDENFSATPLTATTAASAHLIGWAADAAMASADYGWATLSGANFQGLVADATTADTQLYIAATAGVLTVDSSTGNAVAVNGVVVVTLRSGAGATELLATYPSVAA